MATKSNEFITRFRGNDASLQAAFSRSQRGFRAFGNVARTASIGIAAVAAAGLVAGASIVTLGNRISKTLDNVQKMSKRLELSAVEVQSLGQVATLSGGNLDDLEKAIKRMQRTLGDAFRGKAGPLKVFDDLGVDIVKIKTLAEKDGLRAFEVMLNALKSVDEFQRESIGAELFTRNWAKAFAAIQDDSEAFTKRRALLQSLGLDLKNRPDFAAAYEDSLFELETRITGMSQLLGGNLIGLFRGVTDGLTQWADETARAAGGYDKLAEAISKEVLGAVDSVATSMKTWNTELDSAFQKANDIIALFGNVSKGSDFVQSLTPNLGEAAVAMQRGDVNETIKAIVPDNIEAVVAAVGAFLGQSQTMEQVEQTNRLLEDIRNGQQSGEFSLR